MSYWIARLDLDQSAAVVRQLKSQITLIAPAPTRQRNAVEKHRAPVITDGYSFQLSEQLNRAGVGPALECLHSTGDEDRDRLEQFP